jgi:hypothetical protein
VEDFADLEPKMLDNFYQRGKVDLAYCVVREHRVKHESGFILLNPVKRGTFTFSLGCGVDHEAPDLGRGVVIPCGLDGGVVPGI